MKIQKAIIQQRKVLKGFDYMKADMEYNIKLKPIVAELFMRARKLNISVVFMSQSCFAVPKTVRPNTTNYFIMKLPDKRELQRIALNHLSDIEFKDFMKLYKDYTNKPFSFLVNDATLPSDNPLIFRKTVNEKIKNQNN